MTSRNAPTSARAAGRRRVAVIGAAVVAGLVLTGCVDPGSSSGADADLTIALAEEPRSLAAWNAVNTSGFPVIRQVEEALINRDSVTNELVPELALSWEQVDDVTWTFELREGVTFHDGSPFNAEAAAYGINYLVDKDNNFQSRQVVGPELTATAVDEYTLNIVTEAPDPVLPARAYFWTIPSMEALKADPDAWDTKPIGTGPYTFVEWNRGQSITVERNPDWWGAADGALDVEKATFVFRPETQVRSAMVESGEGDLAIWVTKDQCDQAPVCESTPGVQTVALRLDTMSVAMKDHRVREAIALSFDKAAIMDGILDGGELATQWVSASALGFNDKLKPYPYDIKRAKELFEEARADGVPVDAPLTLLERQGWVQRSSEILQYIADRLTEVGFTVEITTMEVAKWEEVWGEGVANINPERNMIGLLYHGNELMDYSATVASYFTCSGNISAYCNPEFDAKAEVAYTLTEEEGRGEALEELAAILYDDVAAIPIGYPSFHYSLGAGLDWKPRLDGLILLKDMALS